MNNRRNFLVKSATALTMTFIVPSLLASNAQAKKPLDQKVTDKKSWGMHIDVDKCVDGCTACVDACNEENGLTGFGRPEQIRNGSEKLKSKIRLLKKYPQCLCFVSIARIHHVVMFAQLGLLLKGLTAL